MTTPECPFCAAPIPDTYPLIALGAVAATATQIPSCADCMDALGQLGDAYIAWHWGMAERAAGLRPPLPSSAWVPTPESTQ